MPSSSDEERERRKHKKKHKKHKDRESHERENRDRSPVRSMTKHRRHEDSRSPEDNRRKIKTEPIDTDYERAERRHRDERGYRVEGQSHRRPKQEALDDSDRYNSGRVKQEPDDRDRKRRRDEDYSPHRMGRDDRNREGDRENRDRNDRDTDRDSHRNRGGFGRGRGGDFGRDRGGFGRGRGGGFGGRGGRGGGRGGRDHPARVKEEPSDNFAFGGSNNGDNANSESKDKEKPDFKLSGKLTEDTNTFRGVVIKYNEPPEARVPKRRWRLYPFKGEEALPILHIHRQSAFLMGRDRKVADIPIDHPSCSKQHAVLQYRMVEFRRPDDSTGRRVRPYIIDLGSANGTFVNNQKIEPQRYVELIEKDVVKFGFSSREYVLLHDKTDTAENDEVEENA